jgi:hypothetical protein
MAKRKRIIPVVKKFKGRQASAFAKPRRDGRFVDKKIAHLYAITQKDRLRRTKMIDDFLKAGDINSALSYLIEY